MYKVYYGGKTEVYGNVKRFDWSMTIRKSTLPPTILFLPVGWSPFCGTQGTISGAVLSSRADLSSAGTKRKISTANASLLCLYLVLSYHPSCPGFLSHISCSFLQSFRPIQCPHCNGMETELGEINMSFWKLLRLLALGGEPRPLAYNECLGQGSLILWHSLQIYPLKFIDRKNYHEKS